MRYFVAFMAFFVVHAALAQPRYPANELPMYGLIQKNEAMLQSDQKFIDAVLAGSDARESGARKSAQLGWQYFAKGDYANAMRRFNQAWLLDENNSEAYHGFAVGLFARDGNAYIKAVEPLFRKSVALPGATSGGLCRLRSLSTDNGPSWRSAAGAPGRSCQGSEYGGPQRS